MKGATAEPSVKTIRAPNRKRKMIMGANHHFLRTFKNSQNSLAIDNLPITIPSLKDSIVQ